MSDRPASTRSPLRRTSIDEEVREELAFHLEMRTRQYVDEGLDEVAAREKALATLGDLERLADDCRRLAHERDRRFGLTELLAELRQDSALALRQFRARPAFSVTAALVLAIGIAAVTAVFGVVYPVLLDPLPLPDPERLVSLGGLDPDGNQVEIVAPIEVGGWRENGGTFEAITAMRGDGLTLELDGLPQRVSALFVTGGFFDLLGTPPQLGRAFSGEDLDSPRPNVVLLGNGLWRSAFGGDPSVLGRTLSLDGREAQVIGVLPPEADVLYEGLEVLVPYPRIAGFYEQRAFYLTVLGRLAPGVALEEARGALSIAQERVNERRPADEHRNVSVVSLRDYLVSDYRRRLLLLFSGVVVLLLIACGNTANLLLARGLERSRDLGVRSALGAGRSRLLRQLLTENLVLTSAAALVGILLARPLIRLLVQTAPSDLPGIARAGLSPAVLGFAAFAALLTALLSGLVPAFRVTERALGALRARARSWRGERLRPLLVAGQVALTLTLLIASGLLVRSAIREGSIELGFQPENLLTAQMSLPRAPDRYSTREGVVRAYERVIDRAAALPGVSAAAAGSRVAFAGSSLGIVYRRLVGEERRLNAEYRLVSADYFSTLEVPILEGRSLSDTDHRGSSPVLVVNRSFAHALFPEGDATGQFITTENAALVDAEGSPLELEIVGVVEDTRDDGFRAAARPTAFMALDQVPEGPWNWVGASLMLVVRTEVAPETVVQPLRAAVAEIDPALPLFNVATMENRLATTLATGRLNALLYSVLGLIALLLTIGGVYGVTAFFVRQQEFEIGVRLALGATSEQIVRRIVLRALFPVALGAVGGLGLTAIAARFLEADLVGVGVGDPVSLAAVLALLFSTAVLASALPAHRTTRVDPAQTLNSE